MQKLAATILCLTAIASASNPKTPISIKLIDSKTWAEPMLPIHLLLEQDAGPDGATGTAVCEVRAKTTEFKDSEGKPIRIIQTQLKCGDRVYTVHGIVFSETAK